MSSDLPQTGFHSPESSGFDPREVDQVLDSLAAAAAKSGDDALSEAAFMEQLVLSGVRCVHALGGIAWRRQGEAMAPIWQIGAELLGEGSTQQAHQHLLRLTLRSGRPQATTAPSNREPGDGDLPPGGLCLLAAPILDDARKLGVVEMLLPGQATRAECREALEVAAALAELAGDYYRRRRVAELQEELRGVRSVERLAAQLHELEVRKVAYQLANGAPPLLRCDRVLVLTGRRRRLRVQAATGVDQHDPRASDVRLVERLAARVAAIREPLWTDGRPADLPPQMEQAVEEYLDQRHVRALAALPLKDERARVIGVLVCEWFGECPLEMPALCRPLAEHAERAVRIAGRYESLPLRRLLAPLTGAWWLRHLRAVGLAVCLLAAAGGGVAALLGIEAEWAIEARGRLMPAQRMDVFAPENATVQSLRVRHGALVRQGDTLLVLESRELAREMTRLAGALSTIGQELRVLELEQLELRAVTVEQLQAADKIASDIEQRRQQQAAIEKEKSILQEQLASLRVASPLDGQVLTWDAERELSGRPVRMGHRLLTVADTRGPWRLELQIEDRRIRHVLEARDAAAAPLRVEYLLATAPETRHTARLSRIAPQAEANLQGQITVAVEAELVDPPPNLRPGASVVARVHCGRRSLGFVWFHELLESARRWLFFI